MVFEALAKCTWLFFCNKVKAGTMPAALSFLKVQYVQALAVLFHVGPKIRSWAPPPASPNPNWQASLVVVQLHLHWARWVLLLRSTMNVYSSFTASSDLWWFLSATFVFGSCVNTPGRYGRRVDVTSNSSSSFSTGNNTKVWTAVGISVCRTTGSYWVSSTLHASIGDNTFTDAKGSVYDSLLKIHF